MDVHNFLRMCHELDLAPGDLSGLLWEVKPQQAMWANEGGFEYQIPLLLAGLGRHKLEEAIQKICYHKQKGAKRC